MVNIIPNQENEEIKVDKEEEIINNGGENTTDDISQIKLIDQEQYNQLSSDEKKEYVKYNPSLTSEAYVEYINTQNQLIEQYNKLGALLNKSPNIQNLSNISSFLNPVKSISDTTSEIVDMISSITSTLSDLGLGSLENILLGTLKLIGAISAILYLMMQNPYLMMKEYQEAFKSIDTESLKDYFNNETTPNLELQKLKISQMVIPDDEIKSYVDNNLNNIDNQTNQLKNSFETITTLEQSANMAETIQNTMDAITVSMANVAAGIAELAKQQVVNSYEQVYDEYKLDYVNNSNQIASNVNNFIHNLPQKYIKATDLEILKNIEKQNNN